MPVDTRHDEYEKYIDKWRRARDAVAGEDAVHEGKTEYLPMLSKQEPEEYRAMLKRSPYFNASGRTLDALVGMVFRKAPIVQATNSLKATVLKDVDLRGTHADSLAERILREELTVYRCGILVEYPRVENVQGLTQAQVQALNLRPYTSFYKTESIVNWREARVNNVMQPVLIVLHEKYTVSDDGYKQVNADQYRVLKLQDGAYSQEIYRQSAANSDYELVDVIVPLLNNRPLNFIPFYAFGSEENELCIKDAMLLDLFNLNLAHYRVSSDYENGCHYTGLPMLLIAGITLDENEKIMVGSQSAIVSDNPDAHGEYIEFQGQGLGALEKNLDRKEAQMAAIGARMLAPEKRGVESAEAMSIKHSGEESVLAGIANMISKQLSAMFTFMSVWSGNAQEVTYKLNTDFMPVAMTPQKLTALTQALQSGSISQETYFYNLKQGEIIAEGRTFEEEQEALQDANTLSIE